MEYMSNGMKIHPRTYIKIVATRNKILDELKLNRSSLKLTLKLNCYCYV